MTKPPFRPHRQLGRTGFVATRLGIGDLADRKIPLPDCVATVRRAMDAGLNLIDTAPGYEDGYSETIVGRALREHFAAGASRDSIFVIDKIDHVDQPVAQQVESSLTRLGLDYADLFVFHGLSTMDGWRKVTSPGDGFDQLTACLKSGKARFRGISSHSPDVLRVAIPSGLCDVVMFAIGPYVDPRYVDEILPLAKAHGVGTVCFKTFGAGKLLGDTAGYNQPLAARPRGKISSGGGDVVALLARLSVRECLHYTLTLDPDVALLGLSFPNEQSEAFTAAADFEPLSLQQLAHIRERARKAIADKGPCWWNPGGK
jgi:aryl-alcohol dehydrogenase-like predicted oxidoreductase